ncbi:MAG: TolC family protein [Syntrophales bacterium]|nr:TolC family protein [Syntrophales bacterium]MDD5642983.1 TolC family protein [Syntrophales bacterium]
MFNRVRFGGLFLALVILLMPLGAGAKDVPELKLKQLITLALKFSPVVKASKSEMRFAQAQHEEVKGYYYPQLDATVIGGVVPNAKRPYVDVLPGSTKGNIVYPYPSNHLHGLNVFGRLDLTLTQPLYTFGKIAYRERAVAKYVKVKEAGVDLKRGEVILQVSEAYYGLVLAEQGKDAVKEARAYLKDTRERITRLLQINSPNVKETDRYRLAMYEGSVTKFAAQAEEGAKVAYKALKALIGYGPDQDFKVPPELPNPEAAPGTLDQHIRTALELRPEFTQLKEGLVARQLLVDAARADQYPSFFAAVMGALAGAPGRETSHDPYINDYFNTAYGFPVVGAKWHFDFGITKAKIKEAQAELQQLQHNERAALMGIPVEVAQAYGKVQENYKASQGLEKSYVNARRWLITSFSNFDMGLGKMEDIFQAFERYGTFRGDYLASLYEYNLATAKLQQATGAYRRTLASLGATPGPAKAKVPAKAKAK